MSTRERIDGGTEQAYDDYRIENVPNKKRVHKVKRSNEHLTCLAAGGGTADECPARRTMIRCTALRAARGAIKLSDILKKYSSSTIQVRYL